ncbi:hypothetical protein C8J56DRAFT_1058692 [Mycena floridula]|nr:hypothetical protein C8J56DRAFT_1058692 [Mycena floridula]
MSSIIDAEARVSVNPETPTVTGISDKNPAMSVPENGPVLHSGLVTSTNDSEDDLELIVDRPHSLVTAADMALAMSGPVYAPYVPSDLPAFVVFGTPADGPWLVDVPYGTVPQRPLVIDADMEISPGAWYAVTIGRWVGVFSISTLGTNSTSGVTGNAWRGYRTLGAAVADFNKLLSWGLVEIRYP